MIGVMSRRRMVRVGICCGSVCLLGWKLPGLLDRTFSAIDEHSGTVAMLRGHGLTVRAEEPTPEDMHVFGAASALTPAERARLLEAARRNDPLAQANAKRAARPTGGATSAQTTAPAPTPPTPPTFDPALLAAMKALGLDGAAFDPTALDVNALLTKVREGGAAPGD